MVANKYAFLQITRRRFLNEWEAFKKVISRRNIRRRITIPLTLSNLKLLRRITRTEDILFFQAEDGIRDLTVTGVQTCALPILCVLVIMTGPSRKPDSSTHAVPVISPLPFSDHQPAKTGLFIESFPRGSTAVTPVRTDRKSVV